MISRRTFLAGLALGALSPGLALGSPDEATALVKRTTERMLSTLQGRRAEVDRNPSLIYGMIDSIVAPHFDFERITQGALGQYWREANRAQQRDLVNGFKQVLVRTYARSLLKYDGEEIRYLPEKPGRKASTVIVSTEVREAGAQPIPVDYRLSNESGAWKVYDVIIDRVSLVANYRSSFASQIRQAGIDGLIAKLGEMNTKGQG